MLFCIIFGVGKDTFSIACFLGLRMEMTVGRFYTTLVPTNKYLHNSLMDYPAICFEMSVSKKTLGGLSLLADFIIYHQAKVFNVSNTLVMTKYLQNCPPLLHFCLMLKSTSKHANTIRYDITLFVRSGLKFDLRHSSSMSNINRQISRHKYIIQHNIVNVSAYLH